MVEYDEIAYSMCNEYGVNFFWPLMELSVNYVDEFYAIKCIPMVNKYMLDGFGTNFAFWRFPENWLN